MWLVPENFWCLTGGEGRRRQGVLFLSATVKAPRREKEPKKLLSVLALVSGDARQFEVGGGVWGEWVEVRIFERRRGDLEKTGSKALDCFAKGSQ
jgi:hypothetical protein